MKKERQKHKTPMKEQSAADRRSNFSEVALGYSLEEAVQEAARCIKCGKCRDGCPVEIDIPGFISAIAENNFDESAKILKDKNSLPAICGRVCPQETQCEKLCPLGVKGEPVAIGRLERFIADWERKKNSFKPSTKKPDKAMIAVVGSGPAGLTCAGDLAKLGYKLTIFESLHDTGGVLRYGIPEFRLPKEILDYEVDYIKSLGVEINTNILIGKTISVKDLFEMGYKAVFIGTGAGLPKFMNIPGEHLNGVFSANEFLTRANLMGGWQFPKVTDTPLNQSKNIIVVGAGNVAMDSARVALRLGADKVSIVYRRGRSEMPARLEEIHHAEEEGIVFELLTLPLELLGDEKGWLTGAKCQRMELGEPDSSGRRKPVPVPGSEFIIKADCLVVAIGQSPNPLLLSSLPDLILTKWGTVSVDDSMMTSIPGVFAGGDAATGAATVISAMGMGKKAAVGIDSYCRSL
jgi:glutamate synthase (NADPH/NADH) small chain